MADITIPFSDRWIQYTATGGQTTFAYDFPIYANTDLDVYQTTAGVITELTLTTDYTVTGVGNQGGGNVELVVGATAGDTITIVGAIPEQRLTDFTNAGDFYAEAVNTEFDKQVQMDQQLRRDLDRSIRLKDADEAGADLEIPLVADRASKVLGFDASGDIALTTSASGSAPTDATYITRTSNSELTAEFAMDALATGIVKNETGTGTPSIATKGTDYYAPGSTDVAVADGGTGSSTAAGARTNLGLGTMAEQDANAVAITGGTASGLTQLDVDNIRVDGNTISSTDANGDVTIDPNGTGNVNVSAPAVFTAQADPTHTDGLMYYDSTDKALTFYNDEADTKLKIGQEGWVRVYNNSGATITTGSIVYVTGKEDTEDRLTIGLAKADSTTTSRVIGAVPHDIENNSFGFVVQFGYIYNVDTSAFADGASMWLSADTAGGYTDTEPESPNVSVFIGYVVDSHATTGSGFMTTVSDGSGTGTAGDATQLVQHSIKGSVGTINIGQVVYVSGYNPGLGVIEVELADSDAAATMPSIGVAEETITNTTSGAFVLSGRVVGFDTSLLSVGDAVYVSGTPGVMTTIKPTGTSLIQKVGIVLRVHVSKGVILVVGAGRSNDIPNFSAADKFWYGGATGTQAEGDVTAFGRSLIDDATAAAGATTLGLGTTDNVTFLNGDFNGTEALKVPTGTTAQRPGTGATGDFRYNTSLSRLEYYDGASWNSVTPPTDIERWVLLDTVTASASASVEFTSDIDGTYDMYCIIIINVIPATDGSDLRLFTSTDGGTSYASSNYHYSVDSSKTSSDIYGSSSDSRINVTSNSAGYGMGNTASESGSMQMYMYTPASTSVPTRFNWQGTYEANDGNIVKLSGTGAHSTAEANDAIKFEFDSGNITSGVFRLYGITLT